MIESNGKIFEVDTRANENAEIAASGLATLTVEMRQSFTEVREQIGQLDSRIDNRVDQFDNKFDSLRQEMDQRFGQVEQTQQEILTILRERFK